MKEYIVEHVDGFRYDCCWIVSAESESEAINKVWEDIMIPINEEEESAPLHCQKFEKIEYLYAKSIEQMHEKDGDILKIN